jgi:hypothetical protein
VREWVLRGEAGAGKEEIRLDEVDAEGGGTADLTRDILLDQLCQINVGETKVAHSSMDSKASVLPNFGLKCHSCTLTNCSLAQS